LYNFTYKTSLNEPKVIFFKVMELLGPPSSQDLLSMGLQDSGLVIAVGAMEGRITGGERMEYF
jgi:hypothetical protein